MTERYFRLFAFCFTLKEITTTGYRGPDLYFSSLDENAPGCAL